MAGNILSKEQSVLSLSGSGSALASGSAGLAATQLDCRASGNAADLFMALFSLTAQWATVTGIAAGTTVADLYLVPAIDGANFPDVDTTAGASYIPFTMKAGSFVAPKAPTANANALFQSQPVDLMPVLYNVYVINRSGQTMSASWAMKALAAAAQYT
jgi:hypothetical protein